MRLSDDVLTFVLGTFALFAWVSGEFPSAAFYVAMVIFDFTFLIRDKQISLPFERSDQGRLTGLLIAFGSWVGYLALTPILVAGTALIVNAGSIIEVTQQLLPDILAQSKIFGILAAMLFGAIETRFFFGRAIEFWKDRVGVPLDFSMKAINIYGFAILLFVGFHIFIKRSIDISTGVNIGLIATFAFAIFQVILVVSQKQTREAVGMHMITNGVAESVKRGLLNASQIL